MNSARMFFEGGPRPSADLALSPRALGHGVMVFDNLHPLLP